MVLAVIKLGGSVVTDKEKKGVFRREVAVAFFKQIKGMREVVLVHGGGSFGHPVALEYFRHGATIPLGISEIHRAMVELNSLIVDVALEQGVPVMPFPASSIFVAENGEIKECFLDPLRLSLKRGMVPLCYGDVVADSARGFSILSGDSIASALAVELGAEYLVYCIDKDGVLDEYGLPIRLLTNRDQIHKVRTIPDITGSIEGKVREALKAAKAGVKTFILNGLHPERLSMLLEGKEVIGTEVRWVG